MASSSSLFSACSSLICFNNFASESSLPSAVFFWTGLSTRGVSLETFFSVAGVSLVTEGVSTDEVVVLSDIPLSVKI